MVRSPKTQRCFRLAPALARLGWFGLIALILAGANACSEEPADAPASLVIGISADVPLHGKLGAVHLQAFANSTELVADQRLETDGSAALEVRVPILPDRTAVSMRLQAFAQDGTLLLERRADTNVDASRTLFLPLRLNDECLPNDEERDVDCGELTCSAGVCMVRYVPDYHLSDYEPDWSKPAIGQCGAVNVGEPKVTIGLFESPLVPLKDGDLVTPQRGSQGASHFFFGVRASGMDDATVRTHYYGRVLSTDRDTSVVTVADKYDINAYGCELLTLPFVLPPDDVIDEVMRLGVTVSDGTGNAGRAHVDIILDEPLPP